MADNALAIFESFPPASYNQILPVTVNTQISEMHKVSINVVNINPDERAKDVYKQKTSEGKTPEFSLTATALRRIAAAAGIQILSSEMVTPSTCTKCVEVAKSTRMPPQCRTCPGNGDVAVRVRISVPDLTGLSRVIEETREFICADEKSASSPGQYAMAYKFRAAHAESKALNRAIRAALAIKGTYTKEELERPFAIPMISPDFDNPKLQEAMIARFSKSDSDLFGSAAEALTAGPPDTPPASGNGDTIDAESFPYGQGQNPDPAEGFDDPFPPDDPDPGHQECHECGAVIDGFTSKNGRKWTAEGWSKFTINKYGLPLCPRCAIQRQQGA